MTKEERRIKVNASLVKKYMDEKGVSIRATAKKMNIDMSYLVRVIKKQRNPGIKFVQGLMNLGFPPAEILKEDPKEKKGKKSEEKTMNSILDYMNTMAIGFTEYTKYEIYNIKNAIEYEKKDRKEKKIKINGNTVDGRKKLNKRIARIAKDIYKINITEKDVQLYKRCAKLDQKDRKTINKKLTN